jgi:hypothetical protein
MSISEGEDFYIVDDLDFADETKLRQIVAEIEALVSVPGKGLRVSVLSTEQWQTVLSRYLPAGVRRGAERYTHVIRDRRDPQHLLVSPSAVRGINDGHRTSYQELVYALLRCIPTQLQGPLRRGVDDIVASICSDRIGVDFFCRTRPAEATLTRAFIRVLIHEFNYREQDWALELRRNPDKVLNILRKTRFAAYWANAARKDPRVANYLARAPNRRQALVEMLRDDRLQMTGPFIEMTEAALDRYLDWADSQKSAKRKPRNASSRQAVPTLA